MNHLRTLFASLTLAHAAWAQVTMRQGFEVPPGTIVGMDGQGVILERDGVRSTLAWDRVRSVDGDWGGRASRYGPLAEAAWRARVRLERGDYVLAEPLLDDLATKVGSDIGPTSRLVFAGQVRCRLSRGAVIAATPAFLAWQAATGGDASVVGEASWSMGGPSDLGVIDAGTLLAPGLPPMWVGSPALQSLARGVWATSAVGELYEQAARFEAGLTAKLPARRTAHASDAERNGYDLVYAIVAARIGSEQERDRARQDLLKDIDQQPEWARVWRWAGVGRSMLQESGREPRLRGVAMLLRVAAEYERVTPYVTGLALGEAAAALDELGDASGAKRLVDEIVERFPGHPVLDWHGVRGIESTPRVGADRGGSQ